MRKIRITQKFAGLVLAVVAALMLTSRSKKMIFETSSIVPAACGSVKIKTDKNKNYTVEVDVDNLSPADQLSPSKKTYVVWMTPKNSETQNIGQLKSSTGFLSKALKGSLTTVTSSKPKSIFITAEDEGNTQYPGTIILSTN